MLTIIRRREDRMKLARPDIRHPRIVLAGCRRSVESDRRDSDDAGLVPALRKRGLHARWLSWDDPDTLRADLVILRATADYTERQDEFLDGPDASPTCSTRPMSSPGTSTSDTCVTSRVPVCRCCGQARQSHRPASRHWSLSVVCNHTPSPQSGRSSRTSKSGSWATPLCRPLPLTSVSAQASCCTPASM